MPDAAGSGGDGPRWTDVRAVRRLAGLFFAQGDFVRDIAHVPVVLRMIGGGALGTVLDAGCGRGMYTRHLLPRATAVTAVDVSTDNLETVRRRYGRLGRLAVARASLDRLPFGDGTFDFVLATEVLEHVPDDRAAVREIARVLKPGGRVVASVPVPPAPIADPEHVREGYRLEALEELFRRSGLAISRHEYCLYGISRAAMRAAAGWNRRVPIPPPSILKLPVLWERLSLPGSRARTPYDVVVEAFSSDRKRASAARGDGGRPRGGRRRGMVA